MGDGDRSQIVVILALEYWSDGYWEKRIKCPGFPSLHHSNTPVLQYYDIRLFILDSLDPFPLELNKFTQTLCGIFQRLSAKH